MQELLQLPRKILALGRRSFHCVLARLKAGHHHCSICDARPHRFLPYRGGDRDRAPLMRDLQVVGSDWEHFLCPCCGSSDRERHLSLYMDRLDSLVLSTSSRVLHIAPEPHIRRLIEAQSPEVYVRGDLSSGDNLTMQLDLCELPFEDDVFDLVIASHVLEHVENVERAVSELHRVTALEGHCILQTPFSPVLTHTLELAEIQSPAARFQIYGQEDHRRLFGQDIVDRCAAPGFFADVRSHSQVLGDINPGVAGVNAREPLLLFRKTGRPT